MSQAQFKIFKETSLPGRLENNQIYLITSAKENYVEMYVTSSSGAARRILNEQDIRTIIQEYTASSGKLKVVQDISARDDLSPISGDEVYVIDAQGDSTVSRGGARYLYNEDSWLKISETEQMDLNLNWSSITGGPTSSATQIDQAVQNMHTHANKTTLDQIQEDSEGNLTYKNKAVKTQWDNVGW